jgi:hypothetical protein
MNTRWLKQNSLLVAFAVAFVAVFGYVGWRLWGQYGTYQQIQASLDEKLAQLEQLQNNDPTPTDNNVTFADENHKRLQQAQRGLLELAVRTGALPPLKFATNIEFAQHLRKTLANLEDRTEKAKIVIPKDFRFGFKRYAATVPDRKVTPRQLEQLGKQLLVVQKLTNLMIKSGVEEIETIKRVEIEPLRGGAALSEDALPDSLTTHPQEHYVSMPFELQLACGATNLQTLINGIATADTLFITRLVSLEQEVLQKKTDTAEAPLPLPGMTEGGAAGATETKPAEPSAPDRPPRLRVKIRLDFIEVQPPRNAARKTP